jgi:4-carboxymuconolactone decarboxylase
MARIDVIPFDKMTAEQKRVNDFIAGKRHGGHARGPFGIWLRNPVLAEKAAHFGDYVRDELSIDRALAEFAILVIARHYTAQYEWFAHERHARSVGIDDAVIEAVRHGKEPPMADAKMKATYALTREVLEKKSVSDATYKQVLVALGETQTVELATTIGFYAMVAMMLVTFLVDVPEGPDPLPVK